MENLQSDISALKNLMSVLDVDGIALEIIEVRQGGDEDDTQMRILATYAGADSPVSVLLDIDDLDDAISTLENEVRSLRDAFEHMADYKVPAVHHPIELFFDSHCPLIGVGAAGQTLSRMVGEMHVLSSVIEVPVMAAMPPYAMISKLKVKLDLAVYDDEGEVAQPSTVSSWADLIGKNVS